MLPPDESSPGQEFQSPPDEIVKAPISSDLEEQAQIESATSAQRGLFEPSAQELDELSALADDSLIAVKRQIEEQLLGNPDMARAAQTEGGFQSLGNIVGVGLGVVGEDEDFSSGPPGSPAVNVYVVEATSIDSVRSVVVNSLGVGDARGDVPMNVIVTGIIDAQPHRFRSRPAPGGISVGHYRITAGTLGCLARGRSAPRNSRMLILSNNHVLANSNNAQYGDPILQQGPTDGGQNPRDRIAILERFVPINFSGGVNLVDAATAWAWPDMVRRELVYLQQGVPQYFRIGSVPVAATRGMAVGKSGRTTQITSGTVTDVSATIRVNYGGGQVALFQDQITIRGRTGDFSRGGDSGSVIWTQDTRRSPVGLLFAGGGGYTFANKMSRVLQALDIALYT